MDYFSYIGNFSADAVKFNLSEKVVSVEADRNGTNLRKERTVILIFIMAVSMNIGVGLQIYTMYYRSSFNVLQKVKNLSIAMMKGMSLKSLENYVGEDWSFVPIVLAL